ncbi:hypothetical protein FDP22_21675 (plasmid) [Paroceanicella profunda]|uniref:Uncharacterized protein n=1 Tax=Paroceanicella profunda TaxID=2579971 RepID=A0A5B8G4V3_9RHOB|nr:hypothetical protein [Paroceanicella profunda]QDL94479.1 hypothetical protein FDP22_21675 [Paroceanicella profunda]
MKKTEIAICLMVAALTVPGTAMAYVGPGAGLSLLGALWALVAALGTAIVFVAIWPIRRMLRRRRAVQAQPAPAASARAERRD